MFMDNKKDCTDRITKWKEEKGCTMKNTIINLVTYLLKLFNFVFLFYEPHNNKKGNKFN